jgi:hypothetical protein
MNTDLLFRWSSVLASITASVGIATAIPYLAGASQFEGSAGYAAMLLVLPTLLLVSLAVRAWGKRLEPNSRAYRLTLLAYCVLSVPFLVLVAGILF